MFRKGAFTGFLATLERDGLSAATASFKDKETERAYIGHLVDTQLKYERLFWWATIVTFFMYAVLDVFTITENLKEVLILRAATGFLVIAMVPFSYIGRLKPYFGYMSALGMVVFAISIIWMISIIPPEGAPPYIIGVLVTFIASSCLMRIHFPVASSVYIAASALYLAVLNLDPDFRQVDIVSGNFFMISIALVAILTIYAQEIRSRMIWKRDQQRAADAAYIEQLLIEATAADRSKINFLSMMSHELRTPLHQIIGYTEIAKSSFDIANDDAPQSDERPHDQILTAAHILLERIQKMLRYADATAGKIDYDVAPAKIGEIVEASLEQMINGFQKKSLRVDSSKVEDAKVRVDIFHTCYALNNILENAREASSVGGGIWIAGRLESDGGYRLTIRDEGPGMSAEQLEQVLQPFAQSENVLVRKNEGLGLGLTIANRIFSDQNAELHLESREGEGLTATIVFHGAEAPRQKTTAP